MNEIENIKIEKGQQNSVEINHESSNKNWDLSSKKGKEETRKEKQMKKTSVSKVDYGKEESYFINCNQDHPPVVATINSECDLEVRNLSTGNVLAVMKKSKIVCVTLLKDYILACGLKTGEIAIIDIAYNQLHKQHQHYSKNILLLNFSLKVPTGKSSPITCIIKHNYNYLLSSNKEGKVVLWDINNLSKLKEVNGASGRINSIVFLKKDYFLCIVNDNQIKPIYFPNDVTTKTAKSPKDSSSESDSEFLYEKDIEKLNKHSCGSHSSKINCIVNLYNTPNINFYGASFPYYMASAGEDATVRLWNHGTCLKVLNGHEVAVRQVIQVNSECIASLDIACHVLIWNLSTGHSVKASSPKEEIVGIRIDCIERISDKFIVGFFEKAFVIWEKEGEISKIVSHNIKYDVGRGDMVYTIVSLWGVSIELTKKKEKKKNCDCCEIF